MATFKEFVCGKNFSSLLFTITSVALTLLLWRISPEKQIPVFIPLVAGAVVLFIFALIIPHYLSLLNQVSELKKISAIGLPQVTHIEHATNFPEFDQEKNEIVRIVTKFSPIFLDKLEVSVMIVDGDSLSQSLFSYGRVEHIQSTSKLIQFIIKAEDKKMNTEMSMLKHLEKVKKSNILIYAGKLPL